MRDNHTVEIDRDRCVGCGLCRGDCPAGNIQLEGGKARVIAQDCILCGHCVAICPAAAVSMTGFDAPPMELEGPEPLDPGRLLAALRTRRSIRQFTPGPVEPETMERIVEAGRLTPTAGNAQDLSYLVLEGEGLERCERAAVRLFRRLLPLVRPFNPMARRMEIDGHFFFKKAPAAILVVTRDKVSGALAAADMALMAEACGLGVLYSGFFAAAANSSPAVRRALGLRRGERVAAALVLGRSAVTYRRTAPKEAAAIRRI